ncbi:MULTISPECIES: protein phosphatase 2C domain-containing protein [unclassified Herbaspirillum]|uniref:PP2C family protein-serine/threonine phosphatase n=1 Tax=unclassified Herbaspirillum TaxID=2624150 RepID=UPI001071BD09|nr:MULTISPECIES: protein phosphatase 2C domain-containing protein [unclassified Herbaspirillum]TFI11241.1 hypothetical protein E4P32_07115 [Herbaspirillum sp. 3R11]TFI17150.1 hypothetical protein E4P31_07115 [Herbaspirillum sp. 3R-11]TFI28895.1 hypothetical protein E4P30_06785 [Herbaspirillum sp. 3C11]
MLNDKLVRWLSRQVPTSGINSDIGMPVTLATDIGLTRTENQDRVALMRVNTSSSKGQTFFVAAVADGMGGMQDGAMCATKTLAAFFNSLVRNRQKSPSERLKIAAEDANTAVYEYCKGKGGATLSAILVTADQGVWTVNVGDSRIYASMADTAKEKVTRLTVDDSLEEVAGGQDRGLLQFIGIGFGLLAHVKIVPVDAERILITSDGVHFIRHETLCDTFFQTLEHRQAAARLTALAKWNGAPDNASLVVLSISELINSISEREDSGIELWDPFGALHIMWVKQEQFDAIDFTEPAHPRLADVNKLNSPAHRRMIFRDGENGRIIPGNRPAEQIPFEQLSTYPPKDNLVAVDESAGNKKEASSRRTKNPKKEKSPRTSKRPNLKNRGAQLSIEVDTDSDQTENLNNKGGEKDESSK